MTDSVGGYDCLEMTKNVERKKILGKLGVSESEMTHLPSSQKMTIKYVPTQKLLKIKSRLLGGEIVSIVQSRPGIFSAHTGFIIREPNGKVVFRHASSKKKMKKVVDESFDDIVEQLEKSKYRIGMVFLRIRDEVLTEEK